MTMHATVMEVRESNLLVCDLSMGRDVVVHTPCAGRFCVGDRVRIGYNGIMTMSLPPQISCRVHRPDSRLLTRGGSLIRAAGFRPSGVSPEGRTRFVFIGKRRPT